MSDERPSAGFTDEQRSALSGILDGLIPPSDDGRLPGAGELGLAEALEEALGRTPELLPVMVQGLVAASALAERRGAGGFAALSAADKQQALTELAAEQPAFLPGLIFHTYGAYYQNARVVEALGFESRPPFPLGYEVEEGDLTALDAMRRRPKLYREC